MRVTTASHSGSKAGSEAASRGSTSAERVPVDGDPARAQLDQRVGGLPGQSGVLPDPGGQADHGGLVGLQGDLGQLEGPAADPVAGLVVEQRLVAADLDRDADLAQLLLVPLEHLLERVRRLVAVAVDDLADAVLGDVAAGDQQADDEVHQPLGLARGHRARSRSPDAT